MNLHTRKWVKPEDLNPNGTLFGGSLLKWIDEEAAIYAILQLGAFGRTALTPRCDVRNKITRKSLLTLDRMVFVNLGEDGKPAAHGKTEITYIRDPFKA